MFKYVGDNTKDIKEKTVIDLTIDEFKEIIREVVAEEVAKHNFVIPTVPVQPYYYQPPEYPYKPYKHQEIWADTKTTLKKDGTIKG